jgi:hypothetical protein
MLPLSYLDIPPHLTLPDEITDQILTCLSFLSRSRLASTISLGSSLLRASISNSAATLLSLDQRLALFLILAAAYEDPGLVHHYRRKATWAYEEAVLAIEASTLAAVAASRRSVLLEPDESAYWGDDWGAEGADEIRIWINGVGDLLNVLAAYQSEVQAHVGRHTTGAGDTGLRARLACREQVVRGVGAWFGRTEGRPKRVSFVLQETLTWREEDILDAYADAYAGLDEPLEVPPGILAVVNDTPRDSTETVWPSVGLGAEDDGEAYESRNQEPENSEREMMAIHWPVTSTRQDYAIGPVRDVGEVPPLPVSEERKFPVIETHRPRILYNDPDIFSMTRPATAGKDLNRRAQFESPRPNEWPLMNRRYAQHQQISQQSAPLREWPLNEHYIPGDLAQYTEEPPQVPKLPVRYSSLPPIKPPVKVESPPIIFSPTREATEKALRRKPIIKNVPTPTEQVRSSPHAEISNEPLLSTHHPTTQMTEGRTESKPTISKEQRKVDSDEKIVADPFLMESGIWKML